MKNPQTFSPLTREVARILGKRIRLGRLERRWTTEELAERVGVSRWTMGKAEKGDLTVSLGTYFEAAVLVRVPLFAEDRHDLDHLNTETELQLALLPAQARRKKVDDDF